MTRSLRIIPTWLFTLALVAATTGCPEEGIDLPGDEIDCRWFDGNNCYRDSLSEFSSLLPDPSETGVLAPDGKRCTYSSGYEVIFINPLDVEQLVDDNYLDGFAWDFEVRTGGDLLLGYRDPDSTSLLLVTAAGTFLLEGRDLSVVITCPSGDQFKVTYASMLASCPIETLPGRGTTWDATGVTFSLRGTGGNDLLIFNCEVE